MRTATPQIATATDDVNPREGRWAVAVSSAAVIATFAGSLVFFQGFLGIAALPGEVPPMDQVPRTAATEHPLALMQTGGWILALAGVLALVGLGGGIHFARRPDGFKLGVWAIALAACTPVLALMLVTGMGAT